MLTEQARTYLCSRGYIGGLLDAEDFESIEAGEREVENIRVFVTRPSVFLKCYSAAGSLAAIHTLAVDGNKEYRLYVNQEHPYLPMIYAVAQDYKQVYLTGEAILTEGVFDRIAVKRALPECAVFARLTKHTTGGFRNWVQRYCRRLWLCLDEDQPGERAAKRAEAIYPELGVKVEILHYPAKDPSALLMKKGSDYLRVVLQRQMDVLRF